MFLTARTNGEMFPQPDTEIFKPKRKEGNIMACVNLKFSLDETVLLVRKVDQGVPEGVQTVQITKSEVHCIELLAERTTYILKSGHHCTEDELVSDVVSSYTLSAKIDEALKDCLS